MVVHPITERRVRITHPNNNNTSVDIVDYGATVVSWKVDGTEALWFSEANKFDGSAATCGGIPMVFPRFGPPGSHAATDKLPLHGFAHSVHWKYLGAKDEVSVQWELTPEQVPTKWREAWPYDFKLIYTLTLGETTLTNALEVENVGDKPFEFNFLSHHYLYVPEIKETAVKGLGGLTYVDKVDNGKVKQFADSDLTFTGETDRIYKSTPSKLIVSVSGKPVYSVTASDNLTDTVIWNPWGNVGGMPEYKPVDGFHHMLCVEHGYVGQFKTLQPESKWSASVTAAKLS